MQILPDVFWVDTRASNVYLCRDADGWTLIDTGMSGAVGPILEALAQLGAGRADLRRILLTHADIDHAAGLADLQQQTGAAVWAGEQTAHYLALGLGPPHLPRPAQAFSDRFVRYKPFPREGVQTFDDGQMLPVLGGLTALATPGHTPDHFSFYAPGKRIVFAGDALNSRRPKLRSTPRLITADQAAADRSALRLLDLDPITIACGHGAPLNLENATERARAFGEFRKTIGQ